MTKITIVSNLEIYFIEKTSNFNDRMRNILVDVKLAFKFTHRVIESN